MEVIDLLVKYGKIPWIVLMSMAVVFAAIACGGDTTTEPAEPQVVEVTKIITEEVEVPVEVTKIVEVEAERDRPELVFAGLSWQSALVQNGVARYIVENGYGYPTSEIEGDTVPLFGLRRGTLTSPWRSGCPSNRAGTKRSSSVK